MVRLVSNDPADLLDAGDEIGRMVRTAG